MSVSPEVEGRSYDPIPPYQVSRVKIAEFAEAVGASDPVHTDVEHARSLGHADVVAPPTFAVIVAQKAEAAAILDPDAGIDFTRVVHGEETFEHARPLVAGDEITAATTIKRVRSAGGHSMVTTETQVQTLDGERVCTVTSTIVVRGE